MRADVSEVNLGPVGVCGVSGVATQEVCAGVVVTFDTELREGRSAEVVVADVDTTADVVFAGTGVTAGVALMLVVAMRTPSAATEAAAEAADSSFLLVLLHYFPVLNPSLFWPGGV